MKPLIIRGDARHLPLQDTSVDLIVTSPPYFGLRSYTDGGRHYDGQIGSEVTPAEYVAALVECTREWVRVLKPSGSLFVNLGDKYAGGGELAPDIPPKAGPGDHLRRYGRVRPHGRHKSLLGLPWRYALAACDQLGLILRSEIIWAKPNGLPESVTDRVRRAHEQVFHFTLRPRYYAAVDEIREGYGPATAKRYAAGYNPRKLDGQRPGIGTKLGGDTYGENPLGKLPGSVWSIPSAPLTVPAHLGVDHFAAFPPALVRPIVLGWSPPGVCTACGEGRRPVADRTRVLEPGRRALGLGATHAKHRIGMQTGGPDEASSLHHLNTYAITGYACACARPDAPTRPSIVVDPFGGTGTTALVASVHGRHGISVDLSADYCRLAAWRCHDPGERARAADVPKPPAVPDGQEPLFELG